MRKAKNVKNLGEDAKYTIFNRIYLKDPHFILTINPQKKFYDFFNSGYWKKRKKSPMKFQQEALQALIASYKKPKLNCYDLH